MANHRQLKYLCNIFLVWKQRKHRSCALPTLCKESLLVTRGGFPTQGVSNAENVSMLWRHMSSTTFSANNSHYSGTPVDMLYPYPGTHTHPALGDELKCVIRKRFRHYSLCGESTVACHCFIIIFVFPSPRPLPCIYTRKGAGRWKHENDNKTVTSDCGGILTET